MKIGTLRTKSMTVLDSTDENRFFEGYLTVEMKDKQGEITVVDELYKVLPIWVDRGAPITDTHSNRVIGKGINFAKTTVEEGGVSYPAIKITGKIHKNYELDTDIWEKIKSGEYKGLSFGGATKANRVPRVMKDGEVVYALTDLEHYEVAVCKDPAVPLALITDYNTLAKATIPSEPRGDGKEIITCTKFGCYVNKYEGIDEPEYHDGSNKSNKKRQVITQEDQDKVEGLELAENNRSELQHERKGGEDFSNADIIPATVTNTVSQSTQTAKPIKTPEKVGVKESEGGVKLNVTPLEGGIADNKFTKATTALSGTGGGVRANIPDGINRQDGGNSNQVTEEIEELKKADINKVIGAILAGAKRIEKKEVWDKKEVGLKDRMHKLVHAANVYADEEADVIGTKQHLDEDRAVSSGKVAPSRTTTISHPKSEGKTIQDPKHGVDLDLLHEAKSGYTTEEGNIQLGNPSIPTEKKEKLTSSLGAQNKETTVTTSKIEKGNFCPTCGDKITDEMKETYTETNRPHADCISCGQKKRIAERDRKDEESMEKITDSIHRGLARSGVKVTRFSRGKTPTTIN